MSAKFNLSVPSAKLSPTLSVRNCLLILLLLGACSAAAYVDPLRAVDSSLQSLVERLEADPALADSFAVPASGTLTELEVARQLMLARADVARGRSERALLRIQRVEPAAREFENPQSLAAVLEALALNHLEYVRFDACAAAIEQLQNLAMQRGLPVWQARAFALQGGYWRRKGDYEQSLAAHEKALELRMASGDRFGEVESLNSIGLIKRRSGELYLALDGHTKALRLARELEYAPAIAEGQRLIARVYAELRDSEQAIKFYQAALDGLKPNQIQAREELLIDLAGVYIGHEKLDEAERLTDEAIRIGIAQVGAAYNGGGYTRRAAILQARGDVATALEWVERAIAAGVGKDGVRSVLVKRAKKQELLSLLKRYPEAVAEGEWVLKTSHEVGDILIERTSLKHYAQALFGNGDSARAYEAMSRFSELDAQVLNSATSRRIADLEASLKRRGLEADLVIAEKARDVSRLQAERQRWISIVAGVLGATLLAAVLALRARVQHARAHNELLRVQSEKLRYASETDALTGLRNRRGAAHELERIMSGNELAVMLIDIDHFKQINDRHGHAGGDDVLRELASRLLAVAPAGWTVARWGGEEFLLFGTLSADESVGQWADNVLQIIRATPMMAANATITVTASLGFAQAQLINARDWENLLQRADIALYEAKVGGRNRVCFAA